MLSAKLKEAAGNSADATLYVDDVFSTWLYTGNGSTQTITNGIDLAGKGGLVWCKSRSNSSYHGLSGANFATSYFGGYGGLRSDQPNALGGTDFAGVSSTGFNLAYIGGDMNSPSWTYVSWTFRKAAKFFDVVTYTGTGSARTIAHSLGVAPGMIIVKRTDTTGDWQVYHRGLTSAAYSIQLNLTDAQASAPTVWNSTAPTSSVFSVGTDATVNASGGTYVAYLFAHNAGGFGLTGTDNVISCGSFTTDGSGNATVNLGWEPQYLLYHGASTSSQWELLDSMRGFSLTNSARLFANLSNAEVNNITSINPTATGFTTATSGYLTGSQTYIYMAIRRPNKPPTSGTSVYNAITRTGTGAAATVTGVEFAPDSVFIECRTGGSNASPVFNRLVGAGYFNQTNSAIVEQTHSPINTLTSFDMNGESLGNDNWFNVVNTNANTYVLWNFKRAPGFFDEVCYTGTGSVTTQAHNLTVVPELMIVKRRDGSGDWVTYVSSVGNTRYSVLNSTAIPVTDSTAWNNTTPTAAVFSLGNSASGVPVNMYTQTYIAYLFATLAGISKVGSYTGNGTGQAIACGFTGGARFVLIKRTDSTGNWYTFDSARGLTSGSSPYLLLNSDALEVTGNNGVYASTGGFTLGATAITTTNIATATYIFLAVA
jgi:hypothetical protein